MRSFISRLLLPLAAACGLLQSPAQASDAANYPARPITLIVPYAPGGQADSHARILAKQMSSSLGQEVLIVNKPGAGTTLGAEHVARAAPDGYTLLIAGGSMMAIAPHTYSSVRYKTEDFQTISLISVI